MKSLVNSFVVAFSMYSKIPMPGADWTKENMKYSMCFFPWVGLAVGALEFGWFYLAEFLGFQPLLRSAGFVLIPVLVTGGIHLDGFLDTSDAMSSWREKERRLEILKDSHAGAFAVICGASYMVLYLGAAGEVTKECLPALCLCFCVSRTFSALSVENFPNANPKGTAAAFGKKFTETESKCGSGLLSGTAGSGIGVSGSPFRAADDGGGSALLCLLPSYGFEVFRRNHRGSGGILCVYQRAGHGAGSCNRK